MVEIELKNWATKANSRTVENPLLLTRFLSLLRHKFPWDNLAEANLVNMAVVPREHSRWPNATRKWVGRGLANNVAADAGKLPRRLHMADARWPFELLGLLDAEQGDGDPRVLLEWFRA